MLSPGSCPGNAGYSPRAVRRPKQPVGNHPGEPASGEWKLGRGCEGTFHNHSPGHAGASRGHAAGHSSLPPQPCGSRQLGSSVGGWCWG